jgi:3-oxoacyl-[acyl-carrier protein] reductase
MSRRCVVTGAASGIGRCATEALLARGHRVLATDIDEAALERLRGARGDELLIQRLDVTHPDDWVRVLDRAVEAWGRVDAVFNIAGYLTPGYAHEVRLEDVDRHFDINTKGVIYGTRLAAERMVAQGEGHIVNIASMAAFAPIPGLALYSASKFAVRAFSLAAAFELRERGVAVTVVCPDAVATPMLDKQKDYEEAALTFTAPRVLTPEEVAEELAGNVLEKRPLEVAMPKSRKWLARVMDAFPDLAPMVTPLFVKRGRARQAK